MNIQKEKPIRILILSCNTGQGHNAASKAVQEAMINSGMECDIEDALCFISNGISRAMSNGHTLMYRHFPGVFRWGYGYAEKHRNAFEKTSLLYRFFAQGSERLYQFYRENEYDGIICAHVFAGLMVTDMKSRFEVSARTYFMSTDYTCSPSTDHSDLDTYFIPHHALTEEFTKLGIPVERLVASGIPVRSECYSVSSNENAKKTFGDNEKHRHLVMMCGSMGWGPMEKLACHLAKELSNIQELTVVCGTNQKLYQKLKKRFDSERRVHIRGYVEDISKLLDSADVYITKPGGISVTEAATKKLPLVFIDAVAGCEEYNMHFFMQRGCAVTTKPIKELASLCLSILSDEAMLQRMKSAYAGIETADAATYICRYIQNDLGGITI